MVHMHACQKKNASQNTFDHVNSIEWYCRPTLDTNATDQVKTKSL